MKSRTASKGSGIQNVFPEPEGRVNGGAVYLHQSEDGYVAANVAGPISGILFAAGASDLIQSMPLGGASTASVHSARAELARVKSKCNRVGCLER